jgi:hypothetical protein
MNCHFAKMVSVHFLLASRTPGDKGGGLGRLPRLVADGLIYHAFNRGNNRAAVLDTPNDYTLFLQALAQTRQRYPF